mgnify:CR=1 FL=1
MQRCAHSVRQKRRQRLGIQTASCERGERGEYGRVIQARGAVRVELARRRQSVQLVQRGTLADEDMVWVVSGLWMAAEML